ncbi:hypothetical protein [Alteraurantiacibacter buctensis]|nr:hypothetical protein [Alteraurantiacibacter buctensis]
MADFALVTDLVLGSDPLAAGGDDLDAVRLCVDAWATSECASVRS